MAELRERARATRAWACYDCGKCTAACPVARVGGSLSPRRHVLAAVTDEPARDATDSSLYRCLTCALCEVRCPAQVRYVDVVRSLREHAHGAGVEPQCPHGGALHSLMRMMAAGGTTQNRLGWLDDTVRTEPERGSVLLWTGCAVYYDAFFPELGGAMIDATRDAVRVLNALGIVPVVSGDERCCGHDLLWNGDTDGFARLARHNAALIEASGAELLVTPCAECLRTLLLDVAPYLTATPPRMVHLGELLAERVDELDLGADGTRTVTFQDPCRLARHLGIVDPPRRLLRSLPGVDLVEMRRHGKGAACCAGGTWSSCDRWSKQLQVERLTEARATGAEVLVTACPKCRIHLSCAARDSRLEAEIGIEMRDVAELVASALEHGGGT